MGDDDNGWGYACVEAAGIWQLFVFFTQFYCELKTALKNSQSLNDTLNKTQRKYRESLTSNPASSAKGLQKLAAQGFHSGHC